jgi:Fuc2NAc and GlcNAc transferase
MEYHLDKGWHGPVLLCLAGAVAGFLVWNRCPARIFMGDTGSGFLGFTLGAPAILTLGDGGITLWSWAILLGVFIVDATLTLLRRMLNGERWYQAHRTHAYQHAARRWGSHRRVTVAVLSINVLWLWLGW